MCLAFLNRDIFQAMNIAGKFPLDENTGKRHQVDERVASLMVACVSNDAADGCYSKRMDLSVVR